MSGFDISVRWRTATTRENGDPYYFPDALTGYFREAYAISAVYRWRVMRMPGEPTEQIYIGEAEDLARRIQRVRTPSKRAKGGDTNRRLNGLFHEYLGAGRRIVLDVAEIEPFEVNRVRFDKQGLGDRFKRRAQENLLLAIAQESKGFELLNIVVDPLDRVEQLFKGLKPHERRAILRRYGSNEP